MFLFLNWVTGMWQNAFGIGLMGRDVIIVTMRVWWICSWNFIKELRETSCSLMFALLLNLAEGCIDDLSQYVEIWTQLCYICVDQTCFNSSTCSISPVNHSLIILFKASNFFHHIFCCPVCLFVVMPWSKMKCAISWATLDFFSPCCPLLPLNQL